MIFVSPITAAYRLAFLDFILREIIGGDKASALLNRCGQFVGECSVIKVVGDSWQCAPKFGLDRVDGKLRLACSSARHAERVRRDSVKLGKDLHREHPEHLPTPVYIHRAPA